MARHQPLHRCIVPGCPEDGRNQLGVRCRIAHSGETPFPKKRRTDAIFSVESDAYLCDRHAIAGVSLTLAVAPNDTQDSSLAVVCGSEMTSVRMTPITQPDAPARPLQKVA